MLAKFFTPLQRFVRPQSQVSFIPRRLPTRLLLQVKVGPYWCTLNILDVHPYTDAGLETVTRELERQRGQWLANYAPYFNSEFRIDPAYN